MTNHFIDRDTDTLWETSVVQGGRGGTVSDGEFMNQTVNVVGAHSRRDFSLHQIQGLQDQTARPPDTLNVLFPFQVNLIFLKIQVLEVLQL